MAVEQFTFLAVIIAIVLFFIGIVLYRLRHRLAKSTLQHVIPYFRAVEIEEFKYLLSMGDEGVMRLHMSPKEFRKEQINRIHEALEHSGCMDHNLWALHEWASHENRKALKTRNREIHSLSRDLLESCAQLRLALLMARLQLILWLYRVMLLRFLPIPAIGEIRRIGYCDLIVSYENIRDLAQRLSSACGDQYEGLAELL